MVTTHVTERGFIRRTVWLTALIFAISALVWLTIFVLVHTATAGSEGEALSTPATISSRLTEQAAESY